MIPYSTNIQPIFNPYSLIHCLTSMKPSNSKPSFTTYQATTGTSSTSSNRSPKRCWCCRKRCCRLSLWPAVEPPNLRDFPPVFFWPGNLRKQSFSDGFSRIKGDSWGWQWSWIGKCSGTVCGYVVDKIKCKFSLSSRKINNLGDIFDQMLQLWYIWDQFSYAFKSFPTPAYVHLLL